MKIKTTFLLSQHCRCQGILEMIQTCDRRISDYKQSIKFHETNNPHSTVIDHYYDMWQLTLKIKERLVSAYSNSLAKIVKPVIDKVMA